MKCEICQCDTYIVHVDDLHRKVCERCFKKMEQLTPNFKRSEFTCKCGCGFDSVNMDHIARLQMARNFAGVSFNIVSGCRCEAHNAKEGGTKTSDHLTGEGTDIETPNSNVRFLVLEALVKVGFRRIGIGRTFIHAGTAKHNPKEVAWLY